MESIWKKTAQLPQFPTLEESVHTDVLIIGGGLSGLLTAYLLKEAGIRCLLVEAGRICSGATHNTTAKITSQHGLIYHKLLRQGGRERAAAYLSANQQALAEYRRLAEGIDCAFTQADNVVYSLDDREKVLREAEALAELGFDAEYSEQTGLPFAVAAALRFPQQAHFQPLQFAAGIAQHLHIYENTPVHGIRLGQGSMTADCGRVKISAENIIIATHFPFINRRGGYFLKMYQMRSYLLALKNAAPVDAMYVDEADDGLTFRNFGDMLLFGGGGHRTGKQGMAWDELEAIARGWYPQLEVAARWANQDCITLDRIPYIGRYSPATPQLFVATGYNCWGISSSMAAALLLRDLLLGRENAAAQLFDPARSMLKPQLLVNAAESTLNLLIPTTRRCPHLGCALKWNEEEKSWDCPCHGSRFTKAGKLINNPANHDWYKAPRA